MRGRRDRALIRAISRIGGRCGRSQPTIFSVDIYAESPEHALAMVRDAVAGFAVEVYDNTRPVRER